MPSSRILSFSDGLPIPSRLDFSGSSSFGAEGATPFAVDWIAENGDILLHFNPRPGEGVVVLNSCLAGVWDEQLVVPDYPFKLEPDTPFVLRFDIQPDVFRVSVDGRLFCTFAHRASPSTIVEVRSTAFLWRLKAPPFWTLGFRPGRALAPEAGPPFGWDGVDPWVTAEENPAEPDRLAAVRLFAVLGTWMEEDVVTATVANCFRQGCERVYLVDNGSSDRTVERALAGGAVLARTFSTSGYDEAERMRQMQAVVEEVSADSGEQHVWWLWLDADEFHQGPAGLTLRDYLATLDRRFRIVGARFFNHFPSSDPAYAEGRHPLDFQPLCYEIPAPSCGLGHGKHPLQRWDRDQPVIVSGPGSHLASSSDGLLEPTVPVSCHHFPFRAEAATRRRLLQLFGRDEEAVDRIQLDPNHAHLRLRLRSLDAVYAGRWQDVSFFPACAPGYVPDLRRWEDWVDPADREVARWY
jgi:hypothetical protein